MLTMRTGVALVVTVLVAGSASKGQEEPSRTLGIDRARIELILLDVEVLEKDGRPARGLTLEDFRLKLDSRKWPVYSVDDLCADPLPEATATASSPAFRPLDAPEKPERPGGAAPPAPDRPRFVLYFDFSELQMDGRRRSLEAARRWVSSAMQPGDEVMVVGYSSRGGITELCPFTSETERILAAIDATQDDPGLVESYPSERVGRISECRSCLSDKIVCSSCAVMGLDCTRCCPMCASHAREDHAHDRRSMAALKAFLVSLEAVEGRKAVFFFYQNTSISSGVFFHIPATEFSVGSLDQTLEDVAANATAARATLNPIQSAGGQFGSGEPAVELGTALANYTGGRFNRSLSDLDTVLGETARARPCIYRIGFEPPEASRSEVYRVDVRARGAVVPFEYRVQHLTEADRGLRKARSVLSRPGSASDLNLLAAILPRRTEGGRWELGIQIVVDVGSIGLLRSSDGQAIDLDVGGLFYEIDSGENWELLTGSSLRSASSEAIEGDIVYARTMKNLPPGTYRLTAFARNRQMDMYGGASHELTVPGEETAMLLGPFALLPDKSHILVHLPLRRLAKDEEGRHSAARKGSVWAGEASLEPGEPLHIVTWLCPAGHEPDSAKATRSLSRHDVPLYRLPEPQLQIRNRCATLTDAVDTETLEGGSYTYKIEWKPTGGSPLRGELVLNVASPWPPE